MCYYFVVVVVVGKIKTNAVRCTASSDIIKSFEICVDKKGEFIRVSIEVLIFLSTAKTIDIFMGKYRWEITLINILYLFHLRRDSKKPSVNIKQRLLLKHSSLKNDVWGVQRRSDKCNFWFYNNSLYTAP